MRRAAALISGRALERRAARADERNEFARAYRLFVRAAVALDRAGERVGANRCRFRGALSLEKSQDWRAHAALWEHLGDQFGADLEPPFHSPHPNKPGQSGMFHIISLEQWDSLYDWYYDPASDAANRHRQAFSYLWAAQGAAAAGSVESAARLYRKTAIAWELSDWGTAQPRSRASRARFAEIRGAKWKLAANCYFLAAFYAAGSGHAEDREWLRVFDAYSPDEYGWAFPKTLARLSPYRAESDLKRLMRCWDEYGRATANASSATEELCQHLRTIQDQFGRMGRRRYAARVHQERERILIDQPRPGRARRSRRPVRRFYFFATRSGTSIVRTVVSAFALYAVLFPILYWSLGLFTQDDSSSVTIWDAVVFSGANLVALSIRGYEAVGFWGAFTQTAQAVSAYFVLGYAIWVLLRSFEE